MLLHKLLYLLLLASLYLFTIMYPDELGFLLFITLLIFPLPLFITLHLTIPKLRFRIKCQEVVEKGETKHYTVSISNTSLFPLSYAYLNLSIQNKLTGTSCKQQVRLSVPSKASTSCQNSFPLSESGCYEIQIEKIQAFSPFSLFSKKIKLHKTATMICLPSLCHVELPELSTSASFDIEGTKYSKTHSGDDPSEIFNLREFHEGDSLRQIHWKLSTKTDTLMVRENSLPLSADITLFLSLIHNTEDTYIENLEQSLSLTLSVSLFLIEEAQPLRLLWFHPKKEELCSIKVEQEEDFYRIFYEILSYPLPESIPEPSPEKMGLSYLKIVNTPTATLTLENGKFL